MLDPIDGYYPRLISQRSWNRVHAHIDRRRARANPTHRSPSDSVSRGIFAYLLKCPHCGNAMNRRRYSPSREVLGPSAHSIVCSLALSSDSCISKAVLLEPLEDKFLSSGREMMQDHIADLKEGGKLTEGQINAHEYELLNVRVESILELIDSRPLDRESLNLKIRNLFNRVVANYPEDRLDFEWAYGGQTSLSYEAQARQFIVDRFGFKPV